MELLTEVDSLNINKRSAYRKLREFFKKYKHAWLLSYMIVYFIWLFALEAHVTTNYFSMYCKLDDFFPFNEWFVIPYYLWFPFVAVTVAYLLFTSKKDYYKCCSFLFIGMTICLLIYTIWPNGQNLRPDLDALGRDNLFIDIIRSLYATDTNTNVCPSIHVYNSIGIVIAIFHNERLKRIHWLKYSSFVLAILICLSTVFLKQHSVVDGFAAMALALVMYALVYVVNYTKISLKIRERKEFAANRVN